MESFAEPALQPRIDLDALLRDYQLGLVLIAGVDDDAGSRPVQWVHSSDLVDPTPFLTPRTVLLTTGEQFPGGLDRETAEAYVERLIAAGTTALGIAVGLRWDRIPPPLVEACDRLGLPLIRVPYDTPFIAITRAAARLIESAVHTQNLNLLSEGRFRPSAGLAQAESALRSAVVQLLIAGDQALANRIAEPILPRLPRGQLAVIALGPDDDLPLGHATRGQRADTRRVGGARGSAPVHTGASATAEQHPITGEGVVFGEIDGRTLILCEAPRIAELQRALAGHAAGLSERGSLQDLRALVDQADRALEHALATADEAILVEYRPAMHSGVLQLLEESPEARRRAAGLLSPVRSHDRRHADAIERSLEVWLRHNGQLSPSAEELQIHRHTLRARIRTAASLLQRDLDSPDTRAELWAALRLSE